MLIAIGLLLLMQEGLKRLCPFTLFTRPMHCFGSTGIGKSSIAAFCVDFLEDDINHDKSRLAEVLAKDIKGLH
jgi:hypothetical protein